ncbi:MAG: hypothetical protein FK731_00470 [Asgard group archaeon]|nr:hypothetical protein [Asgard group archaeon]
MKFFFEDKTVLMEIRDTSIVTGEIAAVKGILYGSNENVAKLVKGFLKRNHDPKVMILILCPKELSEEVLKTGFKNAEVQTGNHNIVVLFTKDL